MHKFAVLTERAVQICAALAALAFFTSGAVYLYLGRWTVTHYDYWWQYDLNRTWLETALLKVNNHSLFFPSLLWLADLRFFRGDQLPLFIAGAALLVITASLLLTPVWHDKTVGLTAKIMSTLVVIVGNFWMGRATITTSGGFNCENSLAMAAAALAFLLLPTMCARPTRSLPATVIVVCAGFVASFSCAEGLATWPTLVLLAWCLRPPRYSLELLALAGLTAAIILKSSGLAEASGAVGLVLALLVILLQIVRRNTEKSSLEFTGVALIAFSLFAMALVVIGRTDYFHFPPSKVFGHPGYFFWSTLFWSGLLLVAIRRAESKQWLRWPIYLAALGLPVLVFPKHYKEGLFRRQIRSEAESSATSLVNGVRCDERQIGILSGAVGRAEAVYHRAEELRARRLDMFADGLQDWIGLGDTDLFGGRQKPEGLKGWCGVVALGQCDNGAPAARVLGQVSKHRSLIPKTLVIVDPTGVVRGVAHSSSTSQFINYAFYLGKLSPLSTDRFVGYIRDYNPQLQYAVRSADDGILSEEKIPVQRWFGSQ
ncbi:MAG: hypothetical protein DMF41_12440 [Verrucomicrobia bacterium]|nr:MAG: hypothetical protein DMF41_12440 [Verrucomicrobiota bacterium]